MFKKSLLFIALISPFWGNAAPQNTNAAMEILMVSQAIREVEGEIDALLKAIAQTEEKKIGGGVVGILRSLVGAQATRPGKKDQSVDDLYVAWRHLLVKQGAQEKLQVQIEQTPIEAQAKIQKEIEDTTMLLEAQRKRLDSSIGFLQSGDGALYNLAKGVVGGLHATTATLLAKGDDYRASKAQGDVIKVLKEIEGTEKKIEDLKIKKTDFAKDPAYKAKAASLKKEMDTVLEELQKLEGLYKEKLSIFKSKYEKQAELLLQRRSALVNSLKGQCGEEDFADCQKEALAFMEKNAVSVQACYEIKPTWTLDQLNACRVGYMQKKLCSASTVGIACYKKMAEELMNKTKSKGFGACEKESSDDAFKSCVLKQSDARKLLTAAL